MSNKCLKGDKFTKKRVKRVKKLMEILLTLRKRYKTQINNNNNNCVMTTTEAIIQSKFASNT